MDTEIVQWLKELATFSDNLSLIPGLMTNVYNFCPMGSDASDGIKAYGTHSDKTDFKKNYYFTFILRFNHSFPFHPSSCLLVLTHLPSAQPRLPTVRGSNQKSTKTGTLSWGSTNPFPLH